MTQANDNSAAVVVLPSVGGGRITDPKLRSWLAQSLLLQSTRPRELLARVLNALNLPYPDTGLAALRMWGQTGDRPTAWIAAADPVYLEPRLDHLCLHALRDEQLSAAGLRIVFNHLQKTLADEANFGFARIGKCGYLRASTPMATARMPPYVVDQQLPNDHMPTGEDAASYHNLRSEVEMALHDHEINRNREAAGMPPINSLWLWGGGFPPEQQTEVRPPLYANEPLLKGSWLSKAGVVSAWPGSIAACLDASVGGFVAVASQSAGDDAWLGACLHELRNALRSGQLSALTLLFDDGYTAELRRADAWRFWRRTAPLLD